MLDGEAYEINGVGFAGCMGAMGGYGRGMLSSFGEPAPRGVPVYNCARMVALAATGRPYTLFEI